MQSNGILLVKLSELVTSLDSQTNEINTERKLNNGQPISNSFLLAQLSYIINRFIRLAL